MRRNNASTISQEDTHIQGPLIGARQLIWIAFGLLLLGYGLFAFNAGSKISPLTNKAADNIALSTQIMREAEIGADLRGSDEVLQTMPAWMNFMADISSSAYVYGEDSLMETEIYYHSMPDTGRAVLGSHMMLGVVLMATGFLQFWSAFRRRHRKIHRITGVVYIVTVFTSMTLSGVHLINSGIANTYDTYTFHIGLWTMLIGVVFSVSMASVAILRKKVAVHMGWQAIGFGFLLTAPFQRADWVFLAPLAGDLSFNEMNTLVNTLLFVQVTLIAYVLFLLNRGSSALRAKEISLTALSPRLYLGGFSALSIICLFILAPLFTVNSLADIFILQRMIPEQALFHFANEVNGVTGILFALALALTMFFAWVKLNNLRNGQLQKTSSDYVLWGSSIAAGLTCLFLAYKLGMPNHAHGVAGSGFLVLGFLVFLFFGLFAWKQRKGESGKAVEWLQFLLLASMSPTLFAINIWVLDFFSLVPERYLSQAVALELSTINAVFIPVVGGFILSIYSDETNRYSVS